jgi:hypothetical protein
MASTSSIFRANHTLDLHNSFMGYDVSSHPRFQPHNWLPGYCAKSDDYTFYELVRRDPGVVFVENNLKKYLVIPVDRTELKSPSKNTNSPLDKRYSSVLETIASWILRKIGAAGNCKHGSRTLAIHQGSTLHSTSRAQDYCRGCCSSFRAGYRRPGSG